MQLKMDCFVVFQVLTLLLSFSTFGLSSDRGLLGLESKGVETETDDDINGMLELTPTIAQRGNEEMIKLSDASFDQNGIVDDSAIIRPIATRTEIHAATFDDDKNSSTTEETKKDLLGEEKIIKDIHDHQQRQQLTGQSRSKQSTATSNNIVKRSFLPLVQCTPQHESAALEAAFQCKPRLQLVPLPWPNDTSVHTMIPNHFEVNRCSGGCNDRKHTCLPTRTRQLHVPVMLPKCSDSVICNTTCAEVILIEHVQCRCQCQVQRHHCTHRQVYDEDTCSCQCRENEFEIEACQRSGRIWDSDRCMCRCPLSTIQECSPGHVFDIVNTCKCLLRNVYSSLPSTSSNTSTNNINSGENSSMKSILFSGIKPSWEMFALGAMIFVLIITTLSILILIAHIRRLRSRLHRTKEVFAPSSTSATVAGGHMFPVHNNGIYSSQRRPSNKSFESNEYQITRVTRSQSPEMQVTSDTSPFMRATTFGNNHKAPSPSTTASFRRIATTPTDIDFHDAPPPSRNGYFSPKDAMELTTGSSRLDFPIYSSIVRPPPSTSTSSKSHHGGGGIRIPDAIMERRSEMRGTSGGSFEEMNVLTCLLDPKHQQMGSESSSSSTSCGDQTNSSMRTTGTQLTSASSATSSSSYNGTGNSSSGANSPTGSSHMR